MRGNASWEPHRGLLRGAVEMPWLLVQDRGTRCELQAEAEEVEEEVEGEQCHLIGLKVPAVDELERSGMVVRLVEEQGAGHPGRSEEEQVQEGWQDSAAVVEEGWGEECPADQQRAAEEVEGAMEVEVEGC